MSSLDQSQRAALLKGTRTAEAIPAEPPGRKDVEAAGLPSPGSAQFASPSRGGAGPSASATGSGRRPGVWRRLADYRVESVWAALPPFLNRLVELLKLPAPDTPQVLQRIEVMERDMVLPIKAAGLAILLQSFFFSTWIVDTSLLLDVPVEYTRYFLLLYIFLNIPMAGLLFNLRRLRPPLVEWSVFGMCLVDAIFLGVLTLVTGGYNSSLYWLFLGLIVRSAVSIPRALSQLMLNLTLSACFVLAGVIDSYIARNLTPSERAVLDLYDTGAEPLFLRLVLLWLMTACCYGLQVLLERHRQAVEEAREFAFREGQLRSAGRLAAELAHQIKNPLAIINNAAYSLQRDVPPGASGAAEQIQMIQEEVERADRIITEVMGYAQLSEGHLERLNVTEELDSAIERVFPPAAHYPIKIEREYLGSFPPLLMQRRHATETFINVLQNAREALQQNGGTVKVKAQCLEDHSIEISISDDGPGIPRELQGRIFEAYYTTKASGTGLGLATVKNNVELYHGSIRLESALGKGARFTILFPAKTLMQLAKMIS